MVLDYSGGPHVINHKGLYKREAGKLETFGDVTLMALKVEDGATNQELPAISRGTETNSPPEFPEGMQPCQHRNSRPVRPIF